MKSRGVKSPTSHGGSVVSMRTTVMAMGTSALILSVGNVLLLLLRGQTPPAIDSDVPVPPPTPSRSPPSYWEPRPTRPRRNTAAIWRWMGYGGPSRDTMKLLGRGLSHCPSARRPSDSQIVWVESVWQLQRVGPERMYIYSAYFDDRPAGGHLPSVRVLALSTFLRDAAATCAVWYDGVDRPYVVRAEVNFDAGSGYGYDRQNHREYAYICPLPVARPIPTEISILGGPEACPGSAGYSTLVPIQRNAATERQPIEFGVCVTSGYGNLEPEVLVEWVELNRMYGAPELNLYDVWYSENMSAVFNYYRERDVLRVHALPHPRADHPSWFFNKVRNLRIIALNDCMLKYMYRYRYIIVVDTDEVIVPRTTSNYSALMKELDLQRNIPGVAGFTYVFLNIYFLLDFEADTTKPFYLRTIRHRYRVKPKSWGYAPKSIIDPRQCSVMFNHYCTRYLSRPASPKLRRGYFVPFLTASSHHYRTCGHFYAYTCDQLFAEKTRDDVMLGVETALDARVVPVLRDLRVMRYIIVVDTDEVIVPRTTSNYSALMKELDLQRNIPGVAGFTYVFLNIYFLLDFEADTTKPFYLRTIRHRYRVKPKSWGYAPKSIIDPRQCSVMFNHYCARYLSRPASPKLRRGHRVPFLTASSHHYRKCGHFYAYTCDQLFAEKTRDDVMLGVETALDARVVPVLRDLGVIR